MSGNIRVQPTQLDASISSGELPIDGGARFITLSYPGVGLSSEGLSVRYAPAQALALQHRQLQLSHVQPRAMFGGVMPFQLIRYPLGLSRLKLLVQRPGTMNVEVVRHKHYLVKFGIRVILVHQLLQLACKGLSGALLGHLHPSPPTQSLTHYKHV